MTLSRIGLFSFKCGQKFALGCKIYVFNVGCANIRVCTTLSCCIKNPCPILHRACKNCNVCILILALYLL